MCALDFIETCFRQSDTQLSLAISNSDETYSEADVIEQLLFFLKKKLKISIISWMPSHKEYPSHMLLRGDKGILAYVDFKYIETDGNFSDYNAVYDSKALLETLRTADSQLDRPIFFVYMLNCRDKQGIYFGMSARNVLSILIPPIKYLLKPTAEGVGSNTILVEAKFPSPTRRTGEAASNEVAPQ